MTQEGGVRPVTGGLPVQNSHFVHSVHLGQDISPALPGGGAKRAKGSCCYNVAYHQSTWGSSELDKVNWRAPSVA